jgi:hypothetical protein
MFDALVIDAMGNLGEVCSNYVTRQSMAHDKWLTELNQELRQARNPMQVRDIIERIEDKYDAFDGPGQELIEQLLDAARRRLSALVDELSV